MILIIILVNYIGKEKKMVEKMIGYSIALIVFVVGGLIVTPEAKAAGCEVTVESTDAMSFSTKAIEIQKS